MKEDTKQDEANEESTTEKKTTMIGNLLPLTPAFFQAILIQWTLAFAVIMMLGLDWWTLEFGPESGMDLASEHVPCAILGLWLVTIAVYSIAFGAQSPAGWVLSGSALTMTSFATKLMNSYGVIVPSLPIYSYSGFDVNVPDSLVILCLVGCVAVLSQPKAPVPEQPQEVVAQNETVKEDAPQVVEQSETKEEEATTGPRSLIGQRVAVEKGIDTFSGTVKDYDLETREWLVHYDDVLQEEDELNRVQLGSAFKLYSKNLSDDLKAMWRAGEL